MQSVREVRVQSEISCGQLGPLSKSYQRSDFQVPFLLAAGNISILSFPLEDIRGPTMDAGHEQNSLSSDALLRQISSSIMNSPEFNIARRPEMMRTQQLDGWSQPDGKPPASHGYNTRSSVLNPVDVTPNPVRTVSPHVGAEGSQPGGIPVPPSADPLLADSPQDEEEEHDASEDNVQSVWDAAPIHPRGHWPLWPSCAKLSH